MLLTRAHIDIKLSNGVNKRYIWRGLLFYKVLKILQICLARLVIMVKDDPIGALLQHTRIGCYTMRCHAGARSLTGPFPVSISAPDSF